MTFRMKIVALALLAGLAGMPQALAEELAPGITYEVLKEHDPALFPGAVKVVESIFIMQPGTTIDFPEGSPSTNICTSMLGQVTVKMGNKTVVHRAGDQWTEAIGTPMLLRNTGTVPYVDKTFEIFYK